MKTGTLRDILNYSTLTIPALPKKNITTFDYQISDDLLDFPRLAFCGVHVEIAKNNLTIISDLLDFLVHNILVRELKRI